MSTLPGPYNPIVYAQFNIQGRWRRMLSVTGGYAVVLGASIWVSEIVLGHNLEGWVGILTGLQVVMLLVFGAFRVESAVRGEISSRMLESHRLMPASPLGSILGYIFGAPLQPLLLAVANFGLGVICCSMSSLSPNIWALTNGVLLCFSLFAYAMIVQFAFVARGGFLLLVIGGAACVVLAANEVMDIIPAIAVLVAPLLSRYSVFSELFNASRTTADASFAYLSALGGQLVIALIAIRVAVRRYVSSDVVGISARLGLMLLGVWVALTVLQYVSPESFSYRFRYYRAPADNAVVAETVLAFSTATLLALLPIGSATWTARQAQRSGDPTVSKTKGLASELFTALGAAAIIAALLLVQPTHFHHARQAGCLTLLVVVNFLLSMTALFSWGYLIRTRAWIFVSIWVLLTWLGPIAIDGVYRNLTNDNTDATIITGFSPPGALALMWSDYGVSVLPGIAGQIILSLVPTVILMFTHSRRRRRPIAQTLTPTVPQY